MNQSKSCNITEPFLNCKTNNSTFILDHALQHQISGVPSYGLVKSKLSSFFSIIFRKQNVFGKCFLKHFLEREKMMRENEKRENDERE